MGDPITMDDLEEMNPELVQGFRTMLNYEGDDFAELYDRNFTVTKDGQSFHQYFQCKFHMNSLQCLERR